MKFIGTDYERIIKDELMSFLPSYYEESRVVNEIMRVDSEELESLYDSMKDVMNQSFLDTATWGLDIWERQFKIKPNPDESYDVRRARIRTRIRGGTVFSKASASELASSFSFSGTDAWIEERISQRTIKVGYKVDDLIDLKQMLISFNDVKPAHLLQIVGLLIDISYEAMINTKMNIKQIISQVFNHEFKEIVRIVISDSNFMSSKFAVNKMNILYLNGAVKLDGSTKLDAVNSKGSLLYLEQTEILTIRKYKNGSLIETVVL